MIKDKILNRYEFVQYIQKCQAEGKKVVFTNGCFDLLHFGHVDYLEKAKALGDILVLGLNTDDSIKRLKGSQRPVNREYDRARVMAALQSIDAVTLFDDDTPLSLITDAKPDVLVKGSDYEIKDIVGADEVIANGGSVETIDFVDGYSTSSMIDKIKTIV